jgi:uncharacterized protein
MKNISAKKIYLSIEFFSLFILLPVTLLLFRTSMRRMVIPILLAVCIMILILLLFDRSFDKKRLWKAKDFFKHLKPVIKRLIIGGVVLAILVYVLNRFAFFILPQKNFRFWLIILVLYPLVSAYPQEIIYRLFFFHRYKSIFKRNREMVIFSGFSFGFAHLFFFNFWALILSTIGGILFANTYLKSDSVIITSIEHGLWGDLIFTLGLGVYFYSGAI